ncbi:hypothetical protein DFH07DRAFT_779422 [Mycena maculata]|uniref:Uncharacterized protein n=1 Tax=Mycena maculata TaxID=230809 RepID=A0AAD7I9I5_9AGAR|nr:hypothetical protein DFH07DRAFT_779422 [Mycena maculata]
MSLMLPAVITHLTEYVRSLPPSSNTIVLALDVEANIGTLEYHAPGRQFEIAQGTRRRTGLVQCPEATKSLEEGLLDTDPLHLGVAGGLRVEADQGDKDEWIEIEIKSPLPEETGLALGWEVLLLEEEDLARLLAFDRQFNSDQIVVRFMWGVRYGIVSKFNGSAGARSVGAGKDFVGKSDRESSPREMKARHFWKGIELGELEA